MFFAGYWLSPTIQAVSTMSNLKASKKKKAPKGNKTTGMHITQQVVCVLGISKNASLILLPKYTMLQRTMKCSYSFFIYSLRYKSKFYVGKYCIFICGLISTKLGISMIFFGFGAEKINEVCFSKQTKCQPKSVVSYVT